jgi:hypothetical protein
VAKAEADRISERIMTLNEDHICTKRKFGLLEKRIEVVRKELGTSFVNA